MNLEYWFPTIISYSDWHGKCQPLIDHCYDLQKTIERGGDNWISTVYNTHSTHNIIDDEKFKEINDWALEQANLYSEKIGSKDKLKYQNGWFNIYKKKDFQEYHTHPGSTLSGILVLKANPKTDARTIFESDGLENVDDLRSEVTHKLVHYPPTPGRLILFRSSLRHCVEQSNSDTDRISLAYNFGRII